MELGMERKKHEKTFTTFRSWGKSTLIHSILFVCSANICRSPMAEGLMKGLVRDQADQWRIESSGLWALSQAPAAENTLRVLMERGIDLSAHESRIITRQMVEEFNLILTMEKNHKEALKVAFPEHTGKIFTLREMVGGTGDVGDPVGFPVQVFEETAREIEEILIKGFSRINRLAQGEADDRN
jgi:protein-tyrosine phosphatase